MFISSLVSEYQIQSYLVGVKKKVALIVMLVEIVMLSVQPLIIHEMFICFLRATVRLWYDATRIKMNVFSK